MTSLQTDRRRTTGERKVHPMPIRPPNLTAKLGYIYIILGFNPFRVGRKTPKQTNKH